MVSTRRTSTLAPPAASKPSSSSGAKKAKSTPKKKTAKAATPKSKKKEPKVEVKEEEEEQDEEDEEEENPAEGESSTPVKIPKSQEQDVEKVIQNENQDEGEQGVKEEEEEEEVEEETVPQTAAPTPPRSSPATSITTPATPDFEYEFGGPLGALCVIICLPVVIYGLFFLCNKEYCLTRKEIFEFDLEVFKKSLPEVDELLNDSASYAVLGWMGFHTLLERILPGEVAYGTELSTGERLAYTLSGHLQFWVTLAVVFFGLVEYSFNSETNTVVVSSFSPLPITFIYDHYLALITASTLFSAILSVFVYVKSFLPGALLAEGGVSGNIIYDFFIGRELNPRLGSLDIKEFCELRPGLIGWFVINLGMAAKQMQNTGSVSLSMLLINVFQGFYVWDGLHAEKSILSTMDITTDGFGFMLAFGDLAWVPFIYSLQARYLVDHDPELDVITIGTIVLLQCFGYYVFRAANSEKDAFRRNPEDPRVSHLTYLKTKRGTRLITSGWWGLARKINYTGDWIMTFSWCLLCGWQSPVPYFQAVYFLILLVHRAIRDDKMCHEKYGDDWIEYKRRVPYAFIPYVV